MASACLTDLSVCVEVADSVYHPPIDVNRADALRTFRAITLRSGRQAGPAPVFDALRIVWIAMSLHLLYFLSPLLFDGRGRADASESARSRLRTNGRDKGREPLLACHSRCR